MVGRKVDADALDAELRRDKRLGVVPSFATSGQTLDEFAVEWVTTYVRPRLAQRTARSYITTFDRYIGPRLGHQALTSVTTRDVDGLLASLIERKVGPATQQKVAIILRSVFRDAHRWGKIERNPMDRIATPKPPARRAVVPLTSEQVDAIAANLECQRDAVLVCVLADAGLRPAEARALTPANVTDLGLWVHQSVDAWGELKSTKNAKSRVVHWRHSLRNTLTEYFKLFPTEQPFLRRGTETNDLWTDNDWSRWQRRTFAPAVKAAGLPPMRPYDLRHTFVSTLLAEGKNVLYVAKQAGHSPIMTLQVYGHLFPEEQAA